jgi:hypothetical protein
MQHATGRSIAVLVMAFTPAWANANVGIAPITSTMLEIIFFLIPIVIIESIIIGKRLNLPAKAVFLGVAAANIVSTLAGFIFAIAEVFAAFPLLRDSHTDPISILILLLIVSLFFVLSVAIELPVLKLTKWASDAIALTRAVILANAGSYFLMVVFLIARIVKYAVIQAGLWGQFASGPIISL